jgi:hypothetical protein
MNNDTILSILFIAILGMAFLTGALMGSLRRDTEWRRHIISERLLADQRSADEDSHWETTPRDSIWN